MVFGIGIDSIRTARIAASLQRPGFLQRVYGPEEQAYLQALGEKRRAESAAANFAAKEAFLKAAGRGIGGFALHEIQALRLEGGAPVLRVSGGAAAWMRQNGLAAHLSITHDGGVATAFVVLEKTL